MEGITKERIKELLAANKMLPASEYVRGGNNCLALLAAIECTELDPWLPIESAPLRKEIRLYSREEGQLDSQLFHEEDRKCFTHWREVTEDPKE